MMRKYALLGFEPMTYMDPKVGVLQNRIALSVTGRLFYTIKY